MAETLLTGYFPIFLFMIVAFMMGAMAVVFSFILAKHRPYKDKNAPYECGFDPLTPAYKKFDVRFYLVAILFIIFDLEVAFLFPWAIVLPEIGWFGFWSMMAFLAILTVGFIYEWKKGALEWD